jgi:hypothetical protein
MDTHQIISELISGVKNIEEDLLKQILKKWLDREPHVEDFKKCTIKFLDELNVRYALNYNGTDLGTMTRSYMKPPKISDYNMIENGVRIDASVTFDWDLHIVS